MSVIFAAVGGSGLQGVADDLTGLSYPFTILSWVKYTSANGWSGNTSGIDDTGNTNSKVLGIVGAGSTIKFEIGDLYGVAEAVHGTAYADTTALIAASWQPYYIQCNSGTSSDVFWNGVEESFTHANRDFIANKVGDLVPLIGKNNYGRSQVAQYAVFNRALSAGEKTELLTKTPDNLGGQLPLYYKPLADSAADGIGSTPSDLNSDITYAAGDNPTLTGPTPLNPVFTAGPTAGSAGETTVSVTGTADENCIAQVVVVASGAGQPNDAAFDASSFSSAASAGVAFNVSVTGLSGLTAYDAWVRLKPNLGASAYSSDAFTTTPAAPTITSIAPTTVIEGSTVTVTGSGFTGHTSASINGTAQTAFTVVNDTTVTFTAVKGNVKFGDAITVNIGGTTLASTMSVKAGFSTADIINPLADKAERFDVGQAWDIADGDQVEYDNKGGTLEILPDGTLVLATGYTLPDTLLVSVFDSSDNTWGAEGSIDLVAENLDPGGELQQSSSIILHDVLKPVLSDVLRNIFED